MQPSYNEDYNRDWSRGFAPTNMVSAHTSPPPNHATFLGEFWNYTNDRGKPCISYFWIGPKLLIQSHDEIECCLHRIGVPEPMVKAVCALYAAPTFQIRDLYSISEPQPKGRGVRQGCPLSPYLFIAVLTVVMHDVDQ